MNEIGGGQLDGRLAQGTQINGTLEFERAVQIDGRFEGSVKSSGRLILGPTAEVDADIAVGELEVQGKLRGKVQAKGRLLIRNGGMLEGNIVAGKLAIESGAVFRGGCEMPEAPASSAGGKAEANPSPKAASKPPSKPSADPASAPAKAAPPPGPTKAGS